MKYFYLLVLKKLKRLPCVIAWLTFRQRMQNTSSKDASIKCYAVLGKRHWQEPAGQKKYYSLILYNGKTKIVIEYLLKYRNFKSSEHFLKS